MAKWGYETVGEIMWIKTNQLQRIIRTGRTGHWLNHSKEHCLIGVKGLPPVNRNLDCDVIVAEVRETSRKPDEIYGVLERLAPGARKLEIFGRSHNIRPGWLTLGNQLDGIRLSDTETIDCYQREYPDHEIKQFAQIPQPGDDDYVPPKQKDWTQTRNRGEKGSVKKGIDTIESISAKMKAAREAETSSALQSSAHIATFNKELSTPIDINAPPKMQSSPLLSPTLAPSSSFDGGGSYGGRAAANFSLDNSSNYYDNNKSNKQSRNSRGYEGHSKAGFDNNQQLYDGAQYAQYDDADTSYGGYVEGKGFDDGRGGYGGGYDDGRGGGIYDGEDDDYAFDYDQAYTSQFNGSGEGGAGGGSGGRSDSRR